MHLSINVERLLRTRKSRLGDITALLIYSARAHNITWPAWRLDAQIRTHNPIYRLTDPNLIRIVSFIPVDRSCSLFVELVCRSTFFFLGDSHYATFISLIVMKLSQRMRRKGLCLSGKYLNLNRIQIWGMEMFGCTISVLFVTNLHKWVEINYNKIFYGRMVHCWYHITLV